MRYDSNPTQATLLQRVRDPADTSAWSEFNARYRDLIVRFCRARGLQAADAEDVAQGVLAKLMTGLRSFEYDPATGRFRQYLFRCIRGGLADFWSRQGATARAVAHLEDSTLDRTAEARARAAFEREWIDHHYRLALSKLRATSDARTLRLLEATLQGRTAKQVGEELGMNEPAVHKAQQRIRDRLRELIARQLHDEDAPCA